MSFVVEVDSPHAIGGFARKERAGRKCAEVVSILPAIEGDDDIVSLPAGIDARTRLTKQCRDLGLAQTLLKATPVRRMLRLAPAGDHHRDQYPSHRAAKPARIDRSLTKDHDRPTVPRGATADQMRIDRHGGDTIAT